MPPVLAGSVGIVLVSNHACTVPVTHDVQISTASELDKMIAFVRLDTMHAPARRELVPPLGGLKRCSVDNSTASSACERKQKRQKKNREAEHMRSIHVTQVRKFDVMQSFWS